MPFSSGMRTDLEKNFNYFNIFQEKSLIFKNWKNMSTNHFINLMKHFQYIFNESIGMSILIESHSIKIYKVLKLHNYKFYK